LSNNKNIKELTISNQKYEFDSKKVELIESSIIGNYKILYLTIEKLLTIPCLRILERNRKLAQIRKEIRQVKTFDLFFKFKK